MWKLFALICVSAFIPVIQGQDIACFSGQIVSDSSCVSAENASLCNFTISSELETVNPPAILQERLRSADDVLLTIVQAVTDQRKLVSVKLSNKALCNYPGPNWIKGVNLAGSPSNCLDTFGGAIPWEEFFNTSSADQLNWGCGVELDNTDPNSIIYRGDAAVTWLDTIVVPDPVRPFNVTRETTSVLHYQLEYPKEVTIQASVTEVSDPRVLSAVTHQKYNSSTGKLEIQVVTSVQTPYRLNSIQVANLPSLISSSQVLLSDCANGSSPCVQQWHIELSRTDPKCDFNGAYNFTFSTGCQSAINCALDDSQIIKYIIFSLSTGDVCGSVSDVTAVTAQLDSFGGFENGDFSAARIAFLPSQTVYFRLKLTSDGAGLASSSIQSVTATDVNGATQTLVSSGVAQIVSYDTQLVSSTALVQTHEIEFQFEPSWFGTLSPDQIASSTITVTASLNFNGKRSLTVRASFNEANALAQVSLKGEAASLLGAEEESGSSSFIPSLLMAVICFVASLL